MRKLQRGFPSLYYTSREKYGIVNLIILYITEKFFFLFFFLNSSSKFPSRLALKRSRRFLQTRQ